MITFDGNFQAFLSDLKKAEEELYHQINLQYYYKLLTMFGELVNLSPQFSGNLARNWRAGKNYANEAYEQVDRKDYGPGFFVRENGEFGFARYGTAFKRGDDPATSLAISDAALSLEGITYKDKAVFTNTAPYADEVNEGRPPPGTNWRPVNLVDGRVVMLWYLQEKYS